MVGNGRLSEVTCLLEEGCDGKQVIRTVTSPRGASSKMRYVFDSRIACSCCLVSVLALLLSMLYIYNMHFLPTNLSVRYKQWSNSTSTDSSMSILWLPQEPTLDKGVRLTLPTDFYETYAAMVWALIFQLPQGIRRLFEAVEIQFTASLLPYLFWESPSSSDVNLVGTNLPRHCRTCFLLAEDHSVFDRSGFKLELAMPDYDSFPAVATIHLDDTWTIVDFNLDQTLPEELGKLNPSDVVRNLLTNVLNLQLHTMVHACATTLSHLARHHIPPGHQVHTFLTDFLHPWLSVAIDIQGYFAAALGVAAGTAVEVFTPDVTDSYFQFSVLGTGEHPPEKRHWQPFRRVLEMTRTVKQFSSFPGASRFLDASVLFEGTATNFVDALYDSDKALRADRAVMAYLGAVRTVLDPYTEILDTPNLVPKYYRQVSRSTLVSVLVWFMNVLHVHSVVMAEDLYITDTNVNPLPKWTLYEKGAHKILADALIGRLAQIPHTQPVSAYVHDANWPHADTKSIVQEFQSSLKQRELNITYSCW